MFPLYFEKKIVKKLIEHDALVLLADGFNELNIVALFIFYYNNKCLWYKNYLKKENFFFYLFKLNIYDIEANETNNWKNTGEENGGQHVHELDYSSSSISSSYHSESESLSNDSSKHNGSTATRVRKSKSITTFEEIPKKKRELNTIQLKDAHEQIETRSSRVEHMEGVDAVNESRKVAINFQQFNYSREDFDKKGSELVTHSNKEYTVTSNIPMLMDTNKTNETNRTGNEQSVKNDATERIKEPKGTQPTNEHKLIFILNVTPKEYSLFLKYQIELYEEISKFDKSFNKDKKMNYFKTEYISSQKAGERIEMYIKRGIYFISSNVLLIDLLTFKIIPEVIDGIFICKNHKLVYSMKEIFIIEIFRKRNKFGFIKGISNNKKIINSNNVVNVARKLYVKKIYCFPRFHKNVHMSLSNKYTQPAIFEINLHLTEDMKKIENNVLNLIHYLNIEIKKHHNYGDFDINAFLYSDSAEGYIINYIKNKNLNFHTKKILKEMIVLVSILYNLYNYDSLLFFNFLMNLKEISKDSIWLYCNETSELFYLANERKKEFLKNINIDQSYYEINDSRNIINLIQSDFQYLQKSYTAKCKENEKYDWIHKLVFDRDITERQYNYLTFKDERNEQKEKKNTKKKKNVQIRIKKEIRSEESDTCLAEEKKQKDIKQVKEDNTKKQKIEYPIVILVDNFYTQREVCNLLLYKNGNNFNFDLFTKYEDQINPYTAPDSSLDSSQNSSDSYSKNKQKKNVTDLEKCIYFIPYKIIKHKTENLKYIKPIIYILCINKYYENITTNETFVNNCLEKIDTIHKGMQQDQQFSKNPSQKMLVDRNSTTSDEGKNKNSEKEMKKKKEHETNKNTDIFEINEYSGNLDFLELFLMKVKPVRIILTELNLSIFRTVEIYCARLFKHNASLLQKESYFKELITYEKNEWIFENTENWDLLKEKIKTEVKKEQDENTNVQVKKEKFNNTYSYEDNEKIVLGKEKKREKRQNKKKKKQDVKKIDKGTILFNLITAMNNFTNSVEVFLLFHKENLFYNKYLDNIKTEKTNWLNFINIKKSIRFDVDRNVFNKNKEVLEKAVKSYFLFQKKFKENKKNLTNFNKGLCEEFKQFQEVQADEKIENQNVLIEKLNSNFISMEEEDIFIKNYTMKNTKSKNTSKKELTKFDDKTMQKIQELLENFAIDSFNLNFILYSLFNNTKPIVIVDIRELKSDLSYKLYRSKMHIIPYSLLVGDYVLTKNICVERKTIVDLIQSLNNNRLYNQIEQMAKYYSTYVLLIEFNNKHLFYFSSLNDKYSVYTKLTVLCLQFPRLKILWSHFSLFTAKIFWALKLNAEQPDIFKSLHIGISLQRGAQKDTTQLSVMEREESIREKESGGKVKTVPTETKNADLTTIEDDCKKEENNENNENNKNKKNNENNKNNEQDKNNENNKSNEKENDSENTNSEVWKYETVDDLLNQNIVSTNQNKQNNRKPFKTLEQVTNIYAVELLKSLPGVTSRNIYYIINNVNSLYDLCNKTLEELETYMSKKNAKSLFDFLNTSVYFE